MCIYTVYGGHLDISPCYLRTVLTGNCKESVQLSYIVANQDTANLITPNNDVYVTHLHQSIDSFSTSFIHTSAIKSA